MPDSSHTIVLTFTDRATDGTDLAAIIRENLPDALVTATINDAGAVTGYSVTLTFDDPDLAVTAAFTLTNWLRTNGYPVVVD